MVVLVTVSVNMAFSKDQTMIKNLHKLKKYSVRKLIKVCLSEL